MAEPLASVDRASDSRSPRRLPGWAAIGLGVVASLAVILTLADPGMTVDEPLDVRPGRTYLATFRAKGLRFFDRSTVDAVFRDNAEHPPLGRWLLGLASTMGEPFEVLLRGKDPVGLYVVSGRMAPAITFGALVALVSATAGRRYGRSSGVAAGLALAMMPRVFAHAHFGALDTFLAFFWTLALLSAVQACESRRPFAMMGLAGLAFGLALLTKIHAWFLPPVVLAWAWSRLGPSRAIGACSAWTIVGLSTYFAGWPWLWYDPVGRLMRYLGTGVERVSIQVLYFGQVFADRDVPWHYPWFYLATTVPVGLLALGIWGLVRKRDAFALLLAGSIGMFLVVFSTRIPVYDGERLFLVAFPPLAILIGKGFGSIWGGAGRNGRIALALFLAAQGYGVVTIHPFGLSYYNVLVGGLPGAERLRLELTYWGDAVDGRLLDELASRATEGESAAMAPTLAPDQGKVDTTRALLAKSIILADQDRAAKADWLVVSRREAYWPPEVKQRLARDPIVATRIRQGVWLSALVRRGPEKPPKPESH